jgi:hypothetical protein
LAEIVILDLGRISTVALALADIQATVAMADWALLRPLLLSQEAMAKVVVLVVVLGAKVVVWVYMDKGQVVLAPQ